MDTGAVIHRAILEAVRELRLPAGAEVLDAPCGRGELAVALARSGCQVSGVDIEDELAPGAKAAIGNRFQVADLNLRLPFPDATFDLIICAEGIEHLDNAFAFAVEARRVCKPNGYLIVTTPNILSARSRVRYLWSGFYTQDPRPLREAARLPLHHVNLRPFWQWRYLLHTSGFRVERVTHTHVKPVAFLYALLAPWMWLYTRIAFRKESDRQQRERNREILEVQLSYSALFGENLLVVAARSVP